MTSGAFGSASADTATGSLLWRDVYRRIRDGIASGAHEPGSVLSEREWARLINVGRTPLREALKALAADGWVESIPRRGTRIVPLTVRDVHEIYSVRLVLESFAAKQVAERGGEIDLSALEIALTRLRTSVEAHDELAILEEDLCMHLGVASASENRWLYTSIESLTWSIKRLGHHSLMKPGRAAETLREHERLVQAFRAGDVEEAQRAISTHIKNSETYSISAMAEEHPSESDSGAVPASV